MSASAPHLELNTIRIAREYDADADVILYHGDCVDLLRRMPSASAHLVVTSPPYNIGKRYERRTSVKDYIRGQATCIEECVRVLNAEGSICWQVGNHVAGPAEILPLDIALFPEFARHGLKLRNRIIWHFEHGLHCSKRLSGRYETIMWFTKSDRYQFDVDPIRVPQKYPGKRYHRGPRVGEYSCNPNGKNPGDVWVIPNVKHNHIEKTMHPCQFPVELIERLVLSLTRPGQLVVDPYMGVGTTACAAVMHGRRAAGADTSPEYIDEARRRVSLAAAGALRTRPMDRPVYEPNGKLATSPWPAAMNGDLKDGDAEQQPLLRVEP